jgi:lipid A 4'-phosphatase
VPPSSLRNGFAVILRSGRRPRREGWPQDEQHPSRLAEDGSRLRMTRAIRQDFPPFSSQTPSVKPRIMNRTGLFIALALALVIELLFGIYPELDLKLAALFYDPATGSFPLKLNSDAAFARDAAMWVAWGLALPALVALVVKLMRPDRRLLISGRAMVFLLVTLFLAAGVLTNLTFKSYWGRPRPVVVAQFNGPEPFVAWWDPRGTCARNCSFFSGEGATAFWTIAPAVLTPPALRPVAMAGAILFGATTSVLRMAFGGHFFTDVATAGLVTFLVIWLAYGYIYRWPRTRLTDQGIDAALTRFAWPGYRRLQRWRGRDVGPLPPV